MLDPDSFRERFRRILLRVVPAPALGAGGLAVLCAAALLALAAPGQALDVAFVALVGSLGANVLAGVLQQYYQDLLSQPTGDEMALLNRLAESLAKDIRRDAQLRIQVGTFLDSLNAFEIALEIVKGNPATHGWLLAHIYQDVTEYRSDFDQIHETLAKILAEVKDLTPVAPPALHQLPPPPADFTGREAELAELLQAIEGGGATISGLRGMGGVGKTALALMLAERLAPRYPDAQFFLDLQGTARQPLAPTEAMAHVVRAYQPTVRLPGSEAELGAMYRSLLHGQRALLLMDNAASAGQVGGGAVATLTGARAGKCNADAETPS